MGDGKEQARTNERNNGANSGKKSKGARGKK
jgi:hypothetical protein